ncbi:Wzz/FepE/Etk N-terminal domain-containing protein [Halobacteriovorax marinus]|uniref:Wzz/FepE/Etk N-terminal domain-containing protein n=1 Tax=Halobacteriovorax marinus TaxID=97084 RepID=UPI003A93ADBC
MESKTREFGEIGLEEFLQILFKRKKFILISTLLFVVGALIYAYSMTPIYRIEAAVEVGRFISVEVEDRVSTFESPASLVKRLSILFKSGSEDSRAVVKSILEGKKNKYLVEIVVEAESNELGIKKVNSILAHLSSGYKEKIENYTKSVNQEISILEKRSDELYEERVKLFSIVESRLKLSSDKVRTNPSEAAIFELQSSQASTSLAAIESVRFEILSRITDLRKSLSPKHLIAGGLVERIVTNERPVKPDKRSIVILGFFIGSLLSIMISYFMGVVNEDKNSY